MKIKEIKINRFKRFTDLTISEIPETAKLVVLVGPNGSGKTSIFEALYHRYKWKGFNNRGDQGYLEKKDGGVSDNRWYQNKVYLSFHDTQDFNQEVVKGKLSPP